MMGNNVNLAIELVHLSISSAMTAGSLSGEGGDVSRFRWARRFEQEIRVPRANLFWEH